MQSTHGYAQSPEYPSYPVSHCLMLQAPSHGSPMAVSKDSFAKSGAVSAREQYPVVASVLTIPISLPLTVVYLPMATPVRTGLNQE